MRPNHLLALFACAVAVFVSGCGTGTTGTTGPAAVAVSTSSSADTVFAGATLQLSASVSGTSNQAVTWSVTESGGGAITSSGLYTAPQLAGVFHVVATSEADPSKKATVEITVELITVAIAPPTVTLSASGTQQFTGTVTGLTGDLTVSFSVAEAGGGTVSSSGLYTAPATPGTYHVVATSAADTSRNAVAAVTVTAPVVAITISPTAPTLVPSGTQQFSAAVTGSANTSATWSISEGTSGGAVSPAGLYTAPVAQGTYHVVATSAADPSKQAVATVTVTSCGLVISPASPTVKQGAPQQFTVQVVGCSSSAVTWTVTEANGGAVTTSGSYTAPAGSSAAGTYHVVVTSQVDGTKTSTALVTVPAVAVALSPKTVTLFAANSTGSTPTTQTFTATVTGAQSTAVTWTVQEGAPASGTVTSAGVYSAPATPGTYHVIATSSVDNTKSDSATVTVNPPPVVVTIAPKTPTVAPNALQKFTASLKNTSNTAVNWSVEEPSGGAVDGSGNYTAPATPGVYHVDVTSQADTSKKDTASVLVCASAGLCTPTNQCHLGSISCSGASQSCTDSGSNAPDGSSCGVGEVCFGGSCNSCAEGVGCSPSPDLCALGVTSCRTGQSKCVAGAADPAKDGHACGASSTGVCTAGACACPAGQVFSQGDCTTCPSFSDTTVRVSADPAKGLDNVCCGTSATPGLGGPCLTITQAMSNVKGTGWFIFVAPNSEGNVNDAETFPIHLGKGVSVFLNQGTGTFPIAFLRGVAGKPIFMIDVDTAVASITSGHLGTDSSGVSAGATDGVYVGVTPTSAAANGNINATTFDGLQNGVHLDSGTLSTLINAHFNSASNAGLLCRSDAKPASPSTIGRTGSNFFVNTKTGILASRGCTGTVGGQVGTLAANGATVCPSPKQMDYGIYLEGTANMVVTGSTVTCANIDGISLHANAALDTNNPLVAISNTNIRHSGCAGLFVSSGRATAQGTVIRNNHFGVFVSSASSGTDTTLAPVSLEGSTGPGTFNRNELLCNDSTEPGQCSAGAFAGLGFSLFNDSGWALNADGNFWAEGQVAKCGCDFQLQSCSCSGSAFGGTTPPDGLAVLDAPSSSGITGTPSVVTTNNSIATSIACTQ